eukprot:g1094.t1
MDLPDGKKWFQPDESGNFKLIGPNDVCGAGLEYRMDFETGKNYARRVSRRNSSPPPRRKSPAPLCKFSVGSQCKAATKRGFADAVIRKVNQDGTVNIEFIVDGTRELHVDASTLKLE